MATFMSRRFNHQHLDEKLRNTWKFGGMSLVTGFFAIGLDVIHSQYDRLGIKAVLFITATLAIIAGDWFGFWLWAMANFHEVESGRSGASGWMLTKPHEAFVWLRERVKRIKPSLAIALFVLPIIACVSVVITQTPVQNADPTAVVTESLTPTPTDTPTPAATEFHTPTPIVPRLPTDTPIPTHQPTATFTSSIVEVPTAGSGTFIIEVTP